MGLLVFGGELKGPRMEQVIKECEGMPERRFAAGEVVMEEGGRGGCLFILVEGSVEILKQDFQINTVDSPGSMFGDVSVLLGLPHMATVKTLEASRFLVAENALDFLRGNPEAHLHLSKLLAKRLQSVTNYLVDLKSQFEDQDDHLGMVDEVLESLLHHQPKKAAPASSGGM